MTATTTGSRPVGLRGWNVSEMRLLALLVAVALTIRLGCWQGVTYLDSLNYVGAALRILDQGLGSGLGFHQNDRLGMTALPAAAMAIFGRSEAAAVAYFAALSAAELLLVPLVLARVLPARTTLAATALYALAPAAIRGASTNGADMAMSVWTNIALLLLITAPAARRAAWCAAAGLLLGIGCLHKETALVLLPVVAGTLAFAHAPAGRATWRARLGAFAAFGAGLAVPLVLEAMLFRAWTGDALYRYRSIEATHAGTVGAMERAGPVARYLIYWPANLLRSPCEVGTLLFILPSALLVHAADRFRAAGGQFAWWLVFGALYVVFGTSSRTSWKPLLPYPRYLHCVMLPAAVLAAQFVAGDVPWPRGKLLRGLAVVVPVALAGAALGMRLRGWESAAAGASAALVVALATRRAPPATAHLLAALLLVPLTMAVERARGATHPCLEPERRAVAFVRARGVGRIVATSPTIWALEVLHELGESPGTTIVPTEAGELSAAGDDTAVVAQGVLAERLVATTDLVEVACFPPRRGDEDDLWDVRVLARRSSRLAHR